MPLKTLAFIHTPRRNLQPKSGTGRPLWRCRSQVETIRFAERALDIEITAWQGLTYGEKADHKLAAFITMLNAAVCAETCLIVEDVTAFITNTAVAKDMAGSIEKAEVPVVSAVHGHRNLAYICTAHGYRADSRRRSRPVRRSSDRATDGRKNNRPTKRATKRAALLKKLEADNRALKFAEIIQSIETDLGANGLNASYARIATELNRLEISSPNGARWHAATVSRIKARLAGPDDK